VVKSSHDWSRGDCRCAEHRARHAAKQRERYKASLGRGRQKVRERQRAYRLENLRRADALKLERGCIDCGYRAHPAALHFDHRDPKEKRFSISQRIRQPWVVLLVEIAKCDVRCANCHAVRSVTEGHVGQPRIDSKPPPSVPTLFD
jgi:hypothetical protein